MPTRFQIVAAALATVVAYDLATRPIRTKYNTLLEHHAKVCRERNSLDDQMKYLVHLLNENNVELSDFDLIALPSVTQKS